MKHNPNQTIMRKTNKKRGKKKEDNLPKPLPFYPVFRPLLSLFPTIIYIKIKKLLTTCATFRCFFQHPLQSWDSRKNYLKIISFHGDRELSSMNANRKLNKSLCVCLSLSLLNTRMTIVVIQ